MPTILRFDGLWIDNRPSVFMDMTDPQREAAETQMQADLRGHAKAVRARYDRRISRIVIELDNGLELSFPPRLAQGLTHATPAQLASIEITPLGDGLHWPELDADLYVPGLLMGLFGTKQWTDANGRHDAAGLTCPTSRRKLSPA